MLVTIVLLFGASTNVIYVWCTCYYRDNTVSMSSYPGFSGSVGTSNGGGGSGGSGSDGDFFGMIFGSGALPRAPPSTTTTIFLSLLIISTLYITTNRCALLSLPLLLL